MSNEQALPKTLFCRQEHDSNDPECEWFAAAEKPAEFAEVGEVIMAGRYELIEMVQITAEPSAVTVTVEKKD